MALIKSSPGQQWPGFSFALHPLRVQGFYFALLQCIHIQAFTAAFILSMQFPRYKTEHRDLQELFLRFLPFYHRRYQPRISGYNAACATLGRITAPQRLQRIPDTSATPDAVQVSTAAYYNKVYKGAGVRLLWIHARRCNTSQTMPARRGQRLHLHRVSPAAFDLAPVSGQGAAGLSDTLHSAGQSSGKGTAGGAEPLAALAVSLFGLSPDS